MWWVYFVIPHGAILSRRRERSLGWGYGHIPLFGATVAVGAGLHVAAYYLEHHSELGTLGTTVAVALPLAVYLLMVFVLYAQLTHTLDPFHLLLLSLTAVFVGAAVLLAATGVSLALSLTVLALSPWVTVVGYELVGHRHNERVVAAL
jgi:drug/metabolite transporter (DMT)-like permease